MLAKSTRPVLARVARHGRPCRLTDRKGNSTWLPAVHGARTLNRLSACLGCGRMPQHGRSRTVTSMPVGTLASQGGSTHWSVPLMPPAVATKSSTIPGDDQRSVVSHALNMIGRGAAKEFMCPEQVELAMYDLSDEDAPVRIAVLDLNDNLTTAIRLVRCMLADPLASHAEWESYLESHVAAGQALLLRYGDQFDTSMTTGLLPTVTIPAQMLKQKHMEILICPLHRQLTDLRKATSTDLAQQLLVPRIPAAVPSDGDNKCHRFPVHRTIVCGQGLRDLITYSRLLMCERSSDNSSDRLCAVFDLGINDGGANSADDITVVDLTAAEAGLHAIRSSAQNAGRYSDSWSRSHVQTMVNWLPPDRRQTPEVRASLAPETAGLLISMTTSAQQRLAAENKLVDEYAHAESLPGVVRAELNAAVDQWSERNHADLTAELERAFASPQWRRMSWWRLFWRADDVEAVATEQLRRHWLQKADIESICMAGRILQARLTASAGVNQTVETVRSRWCPNSLAPMPESTPPLRTDKSNPPSQTSGLHTISSAREGLLMTRVLPLHVLAQEVVLSSVSITALTSLLSLLTYLSSSTITANEAGVIAAVGLGYALRQQQRKWDAARNHFESAVKEHGRRILRSIESNMRDDIQRGGHVKPDHRHITQAQAELAQLEKSLRKVQNPCK